MIAASELRRLDVVHLVEAAAGGIRRHVFDLVRGLDAAGLRQALVYSPLRADAAFLHGVEELMAQGIPCRALNMVRPVRPLNDAWAALRLATWLRRWRPAVVHLHSSKAGGVGRLAALAVPRSGVVYTPNASAVHLSWQYLWIERALGHLRLDALIAVSQSEYNDLRSAKLVRLDRLVCVPSGLDAAEVRGLAAAAGSADVDRGLVAAAGRLVAQKDPVTLIEAAARVLVQRPDARFVWVGDGELRDVVESRAAALRISDRWSTTGWLENPLPWLARAEVVALPSAYESFGYVTLEAMILGRPVVATAVSGSVDLVQDGITGLLVPPRDPEALASALLKMLNDPGFAAGCGRSGQARAAIFTLTKMAEGVHEVYRRCARSTLGVQPTPGHARGRGASGRQ